MKRLFVLFVLACSLSSAHAGQACTNKKTSVNTFVAAMNLAEKTRLALEASGAQVALIGRVGQDLSRYNLRYSHMAYVWRDHPNGRWLVVHELNQCGTAQSALYEQGLGNFFLDDLHAFEAVIVFPSVQSQDRIAKMLASNTPMQMHKRDYNMLSYAFSTRYQNSNQWVLETYAAASSSDMVVRNRGQALSWLRLTGFRPITVDVPATTRLGARMFSANIAFDDHPFGRRAQGLIDTVTVESVIRFVRKREPESREMIVRL
jgi:hypothetical protein